MVTREEVLAIARLAKLSVSEEELDGLTAEMANIISFADTINAAEADGAVGEEFDSIGGLSNAFREDVVVPSYDREDILRNVEGGEDGFFCVKKRQ